MIQDREFKELCSEVQKEFPDLSMDQIKEIVKDQFLFAQNHISEGSLTPIYFQYLGRFKAREGRITWLRNRQKRHDTNIESELPSTGDSDSPSEE